jgi:hypothetical protein
VTGINAEVMAGQWEYQVGPVVGIEVQSPPLLNSGGPHDALSHASSSSDAAVIE